MNKKIILMLMSVLMLISASSSTYAMKRKHHTDSNNKANEFGTLEDLAVAAREWEDGFATPDFSEETDELGTLEDLAVAEREWEYGFATPDFSEETEAIAPIPIVSGIFKPSDFPCDEVYINPVLISAENEDVEDSTKADFVTANKVKKPYQCMRRSKSEP